MRINLTSLRSIKYLASSFFIAFALLNLIDSLLNDRGFYLRDVIILAVLSAPLLINKRLFYLAFGIISSLVSLSILLVYVLFGNPYNADISVGFFLLGTVVFIAGFLASLAMIYIGTYSQEKNRFKLV